MSGRGELAVLAVMSWSVRVFLYSATAMIVLRRLMLYKVGPEELTSPYWVAMDACAITALACARIVEMADAPMVAVTRDLVAGLSVMFWAFATRLIPGTSRCRLVAAQAQRSRLRCSATCLAQWCWHLVMIGLLC